MFIKFCSFLHQYNFPNGKPILSFTENFSGSQKKGNNEGVTVSEIHVHRLPWQKEGP